MTGPSLRVDNLQVEYNVGPRKLRAARLQCAWSDWLEAESLACTYGLKDQAALLRPARVILSHHDDWLPGFSVATDIGPIRTELERRLPRTELVELGYVDGHEVFAGLR